MIDKERDKRIAKAHDAFKMRWTAKIDINLRKRVDEVVRSYKNPYGW